MFTTYLMCDYLVGESPICIPCYQPVSVYVNIWNNIRAQLMTAICLTSYCTETWSDSGPPAFIFPTSVFCIKTFPLPWSGNEMFWIKPNSLICPRIMHLFLKLLTWYLSRCLRNDNSSSLKKMTLSFVTLHRMLHFTATMHSEPWPNFISQEKPEIGIQILWKVK